jgi:hypothetical protein
MAYPVAILYQYVNVSPINHLSLLIVTNVKLVTVPYVLGQVHKLKICAIEGVARVVLISGLRHCVTKKIFLAK